MRGGGGKKNKTSLFLSVHKTGNIYLTTSFIKAYLQPLYIEQIMQTSWQNVIIFVILQFPK